ncbi:DUF3606 domain-containing protein [bacterium]|nr:MAG: DUF3606 domain-containing protein [bacterium]
MSKAGWRNRFGCTWEALKLAVKNVGNKVANVEPEVPRLKKQGSK